MSPEAGPGSLAAPSGARRVLIVDDEPDIRTLIAASLRAYGWEPVEAMSTDQVLAHLAAEPTAAVVLDINLGGESGYDTCRAIRRVSRVPILFLTARADEFDHVLGLELGADDYLTKPFSPRVLAAHVAAAVRGAAAAAPGADAIVRHGSLVVDTRGRRVTADGHQLPLSKTEFDLLEVLASDPTRAFNRQTLVDRVWGSWYSDDHVLDVTVARLRRRFASLGLPDPIETVRGVGYRLPQSE